MSITQANKPASTQGQRHIGVLPYSLALTLLGAIWLLSGFAYLPLVLAIGAIGLVVLIKLQSPYLICLGFVVLSYFRVHEAYPVLEPLKLPNALALGTIFMIGLLFYLKRLQLFVSREHWMFLAFAIFVVIGILFSTNRDQSITYFTDSYSKVIVMVFAITWMLRSNRDFGWTMAGVIFGGFVVSLVAIFNMIYGIDLVEGSRVTIGRERDFVLGDPNDLAAILSFAVSFSCVAALRPEAPKWLRIFSAIAAICIITAIIGTQSRGGYLGVLAVFGMLAYYRIKSKTVLIALAVVAAAALFLMTGIADRATVQSAGTGLLDASSQGRLDAWTAAWRMGLAHPFTGVGLDNFYNNYYFFTPHWDGRNHAVHSTWFGVLAETGFVGLTLFAAMLWAMTKSSFTNNRSVQNLIQRALAQRAPDAYKSVRWLAPSAEAINAGLVGFLVSASFLTHAFTWPLYILLALTIALRKTIEHNTQTLELKSTAPHAKPQA